MKKYIARLLGKMKTAKKTVLLVGLPLTAMLVVSGILAMNDWDTMQRFKKVQEAGKLSVQVAAVVHEMQKERGASAGYIGSKGAKFSSILPIQKKATDKAITLLKKTANGFDFSALTTEGAETVKAYVHELEGIGNERELVRNLAISTQDAVAWYTSTNHTGLKTVGESMATAYDPDLAISPDLSMMNAAFTMFLESKERAGIERAVLSGAFTADRLTGKARDKLLKLISLQNGYLAAFHQLAEKDFIKIYDMAMGEQSVAAAVDEVAKMRAIALSKPGGYGVNPEHWFRTITIKINGLHAAELAFSKDYLSKAEDARKEAESGFFKVLIIMAILLLGVVLLAFVIAQSIIGPLEETVKALPALAAGDLTRRIVVDTHDELGEVSQHLTTVFDNLQHAMKGIAGNAQTLAGASEEMNSVSQQMGANAEETSAQVNVVSAASEQISSNIQTVAAGIEELSASAKEIAGNASEAALVAGTAVESAVVANNTITKLDQSSTEIGEIISTITSIAQQTRLLALNATIEAARAGEAGKGFAVVANEVKDLAMETAKASDDINQKIETIQTDSKDAVTAISQISEIITRINDFQNTIASAVEQQSGTANEIARNVNEAAKGSAEITRNITGVAEAAQSTSTGANDTQQAAGELSGMAAELQQMLGQFKYA